MGQLGGLFSLLEDLGRELRHAARNLRRSRGFAAVAIATVALGVGANTAMFSLVEGVLLKPLPYPDPERLVRVFESGKAHPRFPVSPLNFVDYRREARALAGLAAYTREDAQLTEANQPERLAAMRVSHNFFRVLGSGPALGRPFDAGEELSQARVAILSDALWRRRFAADPRVVGRTVRLNGLPHEIVAVMPPGFEHVGGDYRSLPHGETVDLWWPVDLNERRVRRNWHYLNVVGRLRPGASVADAQADLARVAADLAHRYPDVNKDWTARVTPLAQEIAGRTGPALLVLLAAAGVVLLIACVNLANLLLARGGARSRELGVRSALGANRSALVRLMLAESLVIAFAGGGGGAVLAWAGIDALKAVMPADFPRLHAIGVNAAAFAFAALCSLAAALVFGIVPAIQGSRVDPARAMREAGSHATAGGGAMRLRAVLAGAQVALATALLFAAGLLVRSLFELNRSDPGFHPRGVLTFTVALPEGAYPKRPDRARFFDALLARLRELPGVTAAGAATALPWTGWDENTSLEIVGDSSRSPEARFGSASPGFLRALGIPLKRGRDFTAADTADSRPVVLVNEAFERTWLDRGPAVGRRLKIWDTECEIAGVFADIKDAPADASAVPAFYWPHRQASFQGFALAVRTSGDPLALVPAVRDAVRSLDREMPIADVRSMESIARGALAERRFVLAIVGLFAALAVLLSGLGTYGVLAYLLAQRRREIAIRIALGATSAAVVRRVAGRGLAMAAGGLAAGVALGLAGSRLLGSLLYGVGPRDPLTLAAVCGTLALLALAASLAPARRAARLDPATLLHEE